MANPTPRLENLKPTPRMDDTTDPLADSALMARVPVHIDAAVRSLSNRSAWLRRVITEAAQRELMGSTTSFDYAQSKLTRQTCAERPALSEAEGSRSEDGET
jgi:hypothetical protein